MVGLQGQFAHQFGPAVHVVCIVGGLDQILGQVELFTGIGLQEIGIDAARRGIDHLLNTGLVAGVKDDAGQGQVGGTGCLVQVHVAAPAVVGGQVKDDVDSVDGLLGYARLQQVSFHEFDPSGIQVLLDVLQLAATEVVYHTDLSALFDQRVYQMGTDE